MRRLAAIAVTVCVVLAAVAVLRLRPASKLILHVPAGFTGSFILVEDPSGVSLSREWGHVKIDVPPSRIVRVRSLTPLEQDWKSIVAIGEDGTIVPFEIETTGARGAAQALRRLRYLREYLGGQNVVTCEFWIGKANDDVASEFQALRRRRLVSPPASAPNGRG